MGHTARISDVYKMAGCTFSSESFRKDLPDRAYLILTFYLKEWCMEVWLQLNELQWCTCGQWAASASWWVLTWSTVPFHLDPCPVLDLHSLYILHFSIWFSAPGSIWLSCGPKHSSQYLSFQCQKLIFHLYLKDPCFRCISDNWTYYKIT